MSSSEIPPLPEAYKRWVALDDDQPTLVTEPCYIDHRAIEELGPYHPAFVDIRQYKLKHEAKWDDLKKEWSVGFSALSANWNEKLASVCLELKMKLDKRDGVDCLVASNIAEIEMPEFNGWTIAEWRVEKGVNSNREEVHHDWITWKKAGREATVTLFSWRPYRQSSLHAFTKRVKTDGPFHLEVSRWSES